MTRRATRWRTRTWVGLSLCLLTVVAWGLSIPWSWVLSWQRQSVILGHGELLWCAVGTADRFPVGPKPTPTGIYWNGDDWEIDWWPETVSAGDPAKLMPAKLMLVSLPLWMPAALLAIASMISWRFDRAGFRAGRCPRCGYDLTGNVSGSCPECGARRPAEI